MIQVKMSWMFIDKHVGLHWWEINKEQPGVYDDSRVAAISGAFTDVLYLVK